MAVVAYCVSQSYHNCHAISFLTVTDFQVNVNDDLLFDHMPVQH